MAADELEKLGPHGAQVLCASGLEPHPGQWEVEKVLKQEIKLAAGRGWIGGDKSSSGKISWNTPARF